MRKYLTFDKFRLFASILIIAIHTYPLFTINENLDFVFTHVFCRIAVPFFLMITGYFVMEKATQNATNPEEAYLLIKQALAKLKT